MLLRSLSRNAGLLARTVSLVGAVLLAAMIDTSPRADVEAPANDRSKSERAAGTQLTTAAAGFGPVPTNAVLPPESLEQVAERIRYERWQIPEGDYAWPMEDGSPVVETPRLDQLWHTVEPGETLRRLAKRYKLTYAQLEEFNPHLNLHDLESGDRVLVWEREGDAPSVSYGGPDWGRLINGEPLPDDDHYVVLYPHRTFGTHYTISEVKRVLDNFAERYPEAEKLLVGDISYRTGRLMNPHKSHRTGRDVDIAFPRTKKPPTHRRFHYLPDYQLETEQTLSLIKDFIDGGYVQYIFIDRWFQHLLREEAREQGAPERWIDRVFQYPDSDDRDAIVRHSPGHRTHMHIRFACQPTDKRCN
ncbi:MAG: penicillin-insensitive murein endopeptidase [Persicimonas sp.]